MPLPPQTRFLSVGDGQIAYQCVGSGRPLVLPAWWVSHLELEWADERYRRFWEAVADGYTLVRYDRLGVGMSDRDFDPAGLSLAREVEVLRALLDELGLERVTLLGGSAGGCTAVAFAALLPERVDRLLLYGTYSHGDAIAPPQVREAILATVRSHWGLGSRVLADIFLGGADADEQERLARLQREAASADSAAELLAFSYRLDVRDKLAEVRAPTWVVHRRDDRAIPYTLGRAVAAGIPNATLTPLDGIAHFPWAGDAQSVGSALRDALGLGERTASADRTAADGTGPLSSREQEILRLVARGLSDNAIAQELFLSPHTVHRHVANIRGKLGHGSRAAAVAEAARLGLL
jgi:pimeloyl-ACP methyl ester carboxylesterase/DNA-binding CsgD family transcriptional regulator